VLVIFGGSSDLAHRKLLPALANLRRDGLLNESFAVVGVATRPWTDEDFRACILDVDSSPDLSDAREWLAERMYYLSGDFQAASTYERLVELLSEVNGRHATGANYLFYLSTAPSFFPIIPKQLQGQGLLVNADDSWRRVIVEKPFGSDLETARSLNKKLLEVLDEKQIFRIDHYLGKETVQNIVAFRFANGIFEPVWNRSFIDHVQITAAEDLGIEERGRYYDTAGVLRDMVPNHLFQLLTLIAMEPPTSLEADAVRNEQAKILAAVSPLSEDDVRTNVVRGQYGASEAGDKIAYRSEQYVDEGSVTPTFAALKLEIDDWRWAGVPFYLRTGKRLPGRSTEIAICFKQAPFPLFQKEGSGNIAPNWLVIRIQPDEGISLSFGAKRPGALMRLGHVEMDFSYEDNFGAAPATGYERLLFDCILGDATLFQRADMVESAWSVVEPILDHWGKDAAGDLSMYAAGTWGPKEAFELLDKDGRQWRNCRCVESLNSEVSSRI